MGGAVILDRHAQDVAFILNTTENDWDRVGGLVGPRTNKI